MTAIEPINIGLDFGSLGFRPAYLANEEIIALPVPTDWTDPSCWLICETLPASLLGVHFPSIKSRLGKELPYRENSPRGAATMFHARLIELRRQIEEQIGRAVGKLVVAVPAYYATLQREALVKFANQAGFSDVHLLNDSMAAIIGHTYRQTKACTVLLYTIGYSGYEIGLIRVANKRFRTLSYSGGASPSGATFDTLIMQGCLQGLAKSSLWSPSRDLSATGWLSLRNWAERLKETASTTAAVTRQLIIEEMGQEVSVSILRATFEDSISSSIQVTLGAAERLLDEANLTVADLDEVLLAGGCARIPLIQEALTRRLRRPVVLDEYALAYGAAIYSTHSALLPTTEVAGPTPSEQAAEPLPPSIPALEISLGPDNRIESFSFDAQPTAETTYSKPRRGSVKVLSAPEVVPARSQSQPAAERYVQETLTSMEIGQAHRQNLFNYAQQLVEQRYYNRATGFLQAVIQDAQAVLESIRSSKSPLPSSEADHLINAGYELLNQGRFQEAVEHSHRAHALDSETPQIFQQMIDIHCEAATSNTAIEGYIKAIEWLTCAYHNDRTNTAVHHRISERHFFHAQQTAALSRYAEALRALEECLYFDPEHQGALKLQRSLATTTL